MGVAYIILLGEIEETANLGGTLGSEALGVNGVGKARNLGLALLHNCKGKDGKIRANNAAADGLALALAGASGPIAGMAVGEEEADTGRMHDTLLHRKALLVVAAGDADNVSLPLVTEAVGWDLSAHLLTRSVLLQLQSQSMSSILNSPACY